MAVSEDKIAILKIAERKAFLETALEVIAVKSAPWLEGEMKFGYVRAAEYGAGPFSVHLRGGGSSPYPTLDAMLCEWIGD
ncbi:hypothetical protein HFO56_39565 [Rhizobium laguerreae]|uniref:hypothetical protein n=1 Tax=Rhizobium laguerreae TaxID=1076926 RepID=UPI001C92490F|nr:hypothetical protein [Rhizobium laguerreae]MBY3158400.1 hypothetical protein [Rhizobium laguerreae]